MQAASTPVAEGLAYTYQRADGTVERARNAEDAIARCPVLGKLAIEAPDQVNVLLELATLGSAKMAAEAKEVPKKPVVQEKISESKPAKAVEAEKKIAETSSEQLGRIESSTIIRELIEEKPPVAKIDPIIINHDEYERVEKQQREESLTATYKAVNPNTETVIAVSEKPKSEAREVHIERLALPVTDKVEPARLSITNNDETTDLATIISSEIEQRVQVVMGNQGIVSEQKRLTIVEDAVTPNDVNAGIVEAATPMGNDVEIIITESDEPTVIRDEIVNPLDVEYEVIGMETTLEADNIIAPDLTLNMDNDPSTIPLSREIVTDLDEELELLFEPETVKTYFEIRDLIANLEVSEAIPIEIIVPDITVPDESETENESEPFTVPTFETFLATQPSIEEVTLESIKEQSSELPLEQTLVQLVEYLAKSTEDVEQRESLIEIIKDIEKTLHYCYIGQETEEAKLQTTPEMTDRLLTLLRELGYQNPREALVNIIRNFGFEFLTQSLIYLYQLTDEDNRREFLSLTTPAISSNDNSLSRLSKLILRLVMGRELLPI